MAEPHHAGVCESDMKEMVSRLYARDKPEQARRRIVRLDEVVDKLRRVDVPLELRCRRIDYEIPEQFGGGDMGCLGGPLAFWPWRLRPPGTFAIGLKADLLGQLDQRGDHLRGTHAAEDAPLVLRDGYHHPVIGLSDVVGDVVEGEFLVDGLGSMHAAQRRHHY